MRAPLLTVSMIGTALFATASAQAADMVAPEPLAAYTPPPVAVAPPPVAIVPPPVVAVSPPIVAVPPAIVVRPPPATCWRHGAVGWGWYPCIAGPPIYRHDYHYGYAYGYGYGHRYGRGYGWPGSRRRY
jgi:hypothetical protein